MSTGGSSRKRSWISADLATRSPEPENPTDPLKYRGITKLWPEWHLQALCLGDAFGLYFGSNNSRITYGSATNRRAKELCAQCPVFEECLAASFGFREEYGIWAGTTRKERMAFFKDIDAGYATVEQVLSILTERRHRGRIKRV